MSFRWYLLLDFKVFFSVLFLFLIGVNLFLYGGTSMKLYSPAFENKGKIPLKYAMPKAKGLNISPPLIWEGIPNETKSLVLVCVDTHPIANNWIHWVVINIPPEVKGFEEGASTKFIQAPAKELINSYGFKGWGGPQPPPGTGPHPYVFKLFALNVSELNLSGAPTYSELLKAVKPFILAEAEYVGYFER